MISLGSGYRLCDSCDEAAGALFAAERAVRKKVRAPSDGPGSERRSGSASPGERKAAGSQAGRSGGEILLDRSPRSIFNACAALAIRALCSAFH